MHFKLWFYFPGRRNPLGGWWLWRDKNSWMSSRVSAVLATQSQVQEGQLSSTLNIMFLYCPCNAFAEWLWVGCFPALHHLYNWADNIAAHLSLSCWMSRGVWGPALLSFDHLLVALSVSLMCVGKVTKLSWRLWRSFPDLTKIQTEPRMNTAQVIFKNWILD